MFLAPASVPCIVVEALVICSS